MAKKKVQKDNQRSRKHTYKTKDRVIWTSTKNRWWTQMIPDGYQLFSSARSRDFDGLIGIELPVSMYTTQTPIDLCRFNVRSSTLKILTFSVKDRYQLNYFICIKDFNAETITSLKLNLFAFIICCCQYHETKTICLYIFLILDIYGGTEYQYLFSRFLGVSILQLLII
jgi:hypothetical protein